MNERIKQLAEHASKETFPVGSMAWMEMFAQLIVRECAGRVDNILREKKDGGGTMGDEIREHFGVEE